MTLSPEQTRAIRQGVRATMERAHPILMDGAARKDSTVISECVQLAYVQGWLDARGIVATDDLLTQLLVSDADERTDP